MAGRGPGDSKACFTAWQSGVGSDDQRLLRPIVWFLEARSRDGLWTQSDRPNPTKDQWISGIATSILNRYGHSMRGKAFGLRAQLVKGSRRRD